MRLGRGSLLDRHDVLLFFSRFTCALASFSHCSNIPVLRPFPLQGESVRAWRESSRILVLGFALLKKCGNAFAYIFGSRGEDLVTVLHGDRRFQRGGIDGVTQ